MLDSCEFDVRVQQNNICLRRKTLKRARSTNDIGSHSTNCAMSSITYKRTYSVSYFHIHIQRQNIQNEPKTWHGIQLTELRVAEKNEICNICVFNCGFRRGEYIIISEIFAKNIEFIRYNCIIFSLFHLDGEKQ